jgi:hypothetical protein
MEPPEYDRIGDPVGDVSDRCDPEFVQSAFDAEAGSEDE